MLHKTRADSVAPILFKQGIFTEFIANYIEIFQYTF